MFIFQLVICHSLLTLGTYFPAFFWTFITAYVYVFRREQGDHFIQYILPESKNRLIACTEYIVEHAPCLLNLVRTAGAAKPRIGSKRCGSVTGHFNFRNDSVITFGRIINYF